MTAAASEIGRRRFLGGMSFAIGGIAFGSWLPASLLQAAPAACHVDACGDWQLDDICIAYPPYSLHMKPGAPAELPVSAAFDPVDAHWVV